MHRSCTALFTRGISNGGVGAGSLPTLAALNVPGPLAAAGIAALGVTSVAGQGTAATCCCSSTVAGIGTIGRVGRSCCAGDLCSTVQRRSRLCISMAAIPIA
jgi:hypothetical protein